MTQETDEFDELEDLLSSAVKHANKMREHGQLRRAARSAQEVSQDYAERLAEKATFRRLLSDEALDGVRFRWLADWHLRHYTFPQGSSMDSLRKWIDEQISKEEDAKRGPSA